MLNITSPGIEDTLKRAQGLHRAGNYAEADKLYVQILTANPNHAEAWRWRGIMAAQAGHIQPGIDMLRQAVTLKNPYPEAWNDLAGAYLSAGNRKEAIAGYRESLRQAPGLVEVWNNLGIALARNGEHVEAQGAFEKAIALRPDFWDSYNGVGMALRDQGKLEEATAFFEKAVARKGDHPEMLNNLGNCYKAHGRYEEAATLYKRAIAVRPNFVEVHNNLGNAYKDLGRMEEAIAVYRGAIAIAPQWAEIHNNLANALKDSGQMEEALAVYREARRLRPTLTPAHSNLLYVRQFLWDVNPEEDLREAKQWDVVQGEPMRGEIKPFANVREPVKRLRVGYVSPDFRMHSVAFFMEDLLAAHDKSQVETFCYADVLRADAVTERLKGKADHWRSIVAVPDAKVAEMVRADEIDILVELSGHTAANRLQMFARRPAPVQVSYLGYSGTTGVKTIDYRLTDELADPVGAEDEKYYSEKLVRLPRTFICYRPAEESPAVAALPMEKNGYVTFGSFNALPKIREEMIASWARIMAACPGSRLILKTRGFSDLGVKAWMENLFAAHGIAPERLELVEKVTSVEEHLGYYGQVDIGLDTFPYHGTTTTCEALWMGVPVVTMAGNVHRSRVGVSILTNVGLTECIAKSLDEYERIAVGLAGDGVRLANLRSGMRERMRTSLLMDAATFARDVEAAYRGMWRAWCETAHG